MEAADNVIRDTELSESFKHPGLGIPRKTKREGKGKRHDPKVRHPTMSAMPRKTLHSTWPEGLLSGSAPTEEALALT